MEPRTLAGKRIRPYRIVIFRRGNEIFPTSCPSLPSAARDKRKRNFGVWQAQCTCHTPNPTAERKWGMVGTQLANDADMPAITQTLCEKEARDGRDPIRQKYRCACPNPKPPLRSGGEREAEYPFTTILKQAEPNCEKSLVLWELPWWAVSMASSTRNPREPKALYPVSGRVSQSFGSPNASRIGGYTITVREGS